MFDDAVRAVAELAASQHGALTRRQAAALNFDRGRIANALARGWITEPYSDVFVVTGTPSGWHQRLKAATLAGGGHAVASHRSAARLHGLDGFSDLDVVEISVTRRHRWRYGGEAIAHHVQALDPCDVLRLDGVACTGLARTLADVGSVCPHPLVVRRALTDARRRGTSLRWIHLTAQRLHRPGQRGSGLLLAQLARIPCDGRVPDSWLEELLALCLSDPALGPVIPQYPIRRADGSIVAKADIGIPAARLGLEGHSRRFHFGPDSEPLDEQRDLAVATCGWELLYLGWYAAQRPAEVLAVVREIVAVRRATLREV